MGGDKLLLPYGDSSVAETTVARARAAGCDIVLVTGCRAEGLRARFALAVERGELSLAYNPDWEAGMLGSIQAGLRAIPPEGLGIGCLVMPADLPEVSLELFQWLMTTARERRHQGLPELPLVPRCRGTRGHPVFIPATLLSAILALRPDGRLRDFLDSAGAFFLETDDPAIHQDIDTPLEYLRSRGELASDSARCDD
jgi:molybdenum cofactor cytidylyltransferase